jgi:hypothetical protein
VYHCCVRKVPWVASHNTVTVKATEQISFTSVFDAIKRAERYYICEHISDYSPTYCHCGLTKLVHSPACGDIKGLCQGCPSSDRIACLSLFPRLAHL